MKAANVLHRNLGGLLVLTQFMNPERLDKLGKDLRIFDASRCRAFRPHVGRRHQALFLRADQPISAAAAAAAVQPLRLAPEG